MFSLNAFISSYAMIEKCVTITWHDRILGRSVLIFHTPSYMQKKQSLFDSLLCIVTYIMIYQMQLMNWSKQRSWLGNSIYIPYIWQCKCIIVINEVIHLTNKFLSTCVFFRYNIKSLQCQGLCYISFESRTIWLPNVMERSHTPNHNFPNPTCCLSALIQPAADPVGLLLLKCQCTQKVWVVGVKYV